MGLNNVMEAQRVCQLIFLRNRNIKSDRGKRPSSLVHGVNRPYVNYLILIACFVSYENVVAPIYNSTLVKRKCVFDSQ
jgi:hypothetical protein